MITDNKMSYRVEGHVVQTKKHVIKGDMVLTGQGTVLGHISIEGSLFTDPLFCQLPSCGTHIDISDTRKDLEIEVSGDCYLHPECQLILAGVTFGEMDCSNSNPRP